MTMTPYNGDIMQAMKWLQNNAPNIQSLVSQKAAWYSRNQTEFWNGWAANTFNIRTATPFGIMIWCIILGVPSGIFGLYSTGDSSWAYGQYRQNYVYGGYNPELPDKNLKGGNFFGSGNTTILNINEARWALLLRYAALTSNGRIALMNKMLRFILNDDLPWNFAAKNYVYVIDATAPDTQTLTPTAPVTTLMTMEYRIGANFPISPQFLAVLQDPNNGILPTVAGVKFSVIKET